MHTPIYLFNPFFNTRITSMRWEHFSFFSRWIKIWRWEGKVLYKVFRFPIVPFLYLLYSSSEPLSICTCVCVQLFYTRCGDNHVDRWFIRSDEGKRLEAKGRKGLVCDDDEVSAKSRQDLLDWHHSQSFDFPRRKKERKEGKKSESAISFLLSTK